MAWQWLLHGCEHAGPWPFVLSLWATTATGVAILKTRQARFYRRLFIAQVEGEARRAAEAASVAIWNAYDARVGCAPTRAADDPCPPSEARS